MKNPVVGWRVKERSRLLTRLRFEIARQIMDQFLGEEPEVLLTEPGKGTTVLSRTPDYRQVVLPGPLPLGCFAPVRIEEAHATDLRGRLLGVPTASPGRASPR
jgi:tRNA A37 methylthiotransferase MiaB